MKQFLTIASIIILAFATYTFGKVTPEIVDDINIVTAIAFDKDGKKNIIGTAVIPVFKADKSIENETFTQESALAKEIINILQKKSADPLVTGGIKVSLYEEALAREGLVNYVDALQRDASIGSKLYLAVVNGKAGDILKKNLGNRGTGNYLSTLLKHNIERRDVPVSYLHTFLFRYYEKGMDPYLPYIKLIDNKVEIDGLAIFKDEKMVDIIDEPDMFFFKSLVENFGAGSYTLNIENSTEYASIRRIVSKREINVTEKNGKSKVVISIYLKGLISEYSGRQLNEKIIVKITKELEKHIKQKSEAMIETFISKDVDPIGLGYLAKSKLRNFDQQKWEDSYSNLDFEVNAKVVLTETGVIQ